MRKTKLKLGVYKPNAGEDESHFFIDDYNLCLSHGKHKGEGDCLGRTARAYFVHNDDLLIEGISNCWDEYLLDGNMVGIRHPSLGPHTTNDTFWNRRMSRDHYIYTLFALKLWSNRNGKTHHKLKKIVESTPFVFRRMGRWTLSLVLWSKSLMGNNLALWLYLIIEIFLVNVFYIPVRKLVYKLGGWYPEVDQDEFELKPMLQDLPEWKQRLTKITMPAFGMLFTSFQLYITPDRFPKLKRTLQKSYLKLVGETNYVQQMLLGKKDIPRDKVISYKSMVGGRWSTYFNNRNDRNLYVYPNKGKVNKFDMDLVRYLYNETQL